MDTTLRKPYDFFPAMERLSRHADEMSAEERRALKAAVVLNAPDPRAVALHVDLSGEQLGDIYPPRVEEAPITTGAAIDTFLDRYGRSTPEEDALLERLIFNPVPDYGQVLAAEDEAEEDNPETLASLAAAINGTPDSGEPVEPHTTEVENVAVDNAVTAEETTKVVDTNPARAVGSSARPKRQSAPPLTLELAKIFIKQGQFDRAYEIISKINLNNSGKSIYFADQMRFLEKLMAIQRAKRP